MSSSAIRFALGRLPTPPHDVLLVGTGKTIRLAVDHLEGARLYVATRRKRHTSPGARTIKYAELAKTAKKCDLIVCATNHRGYLLKGRLPGAKRRVILDLAFPRNVDPRIRDGGSTEVFDLDDLARVLSRERSLRAQTARRASELVKSEAERFSRWLLASRQSPALSRVYRWAETVRNEEAEAALRRLPDLSAREKEVVQAMSKRLVSKLLAPPTKFTKSTSPEFPQGQRLDVVSQIFDLGEG